MSKLTSVYPTEWLVRDMSFVIPAKAGIHWLFSSWIPACAGMTGFNLDSNE